MPYLIGQCCTDQIPTGGGSVDSGIGDLSGKNEVIYFNAPIQGDNYIEVAWTAARKARFGDAPVLQWETVGFTEIPGQYYRAPGENIFPDQVPNTTKFTFYTNGPTSGRIIIS